MYDLVPLKTLVQQVLHKYEYSFVQSVLLHYLFAAVASTYCTPSAIF